MNKLKSFFKDIPLSIRLFLGKALLFFIVWKLIFNFFLSESKILDYPLTTHVAEASTFLLNHSLLLSNFTTERVIAEWDGILEEASEIFHNGDLVLYIGDACNGLELFVLYIGFIVCMPAKFRRKVKYIIIGILILDLVNILRCCGLIYLTEYFHQYFDFAHKYLFKIIIYAATFLMWIVFSRKLSLKNETV